MLTVDEALSRVLAAAQPRNTVDADFDAALGLVLAEDVVSDVDSPPHDKSIVDGFALRAADLADGPAKLAIVEEIVAGHVPTRHIEPGQSARIMTGAPIPTGADAVVMVERTETISDARHPLGIVRIGQSPVTTGQNIARRGISMRAGQTVLTFGTVIRPAEIGLLAEVGRTRVRVSARPAVAVLSTGNELVPCDQRPGPSQIRNSNGPMLAAAVRTAGGDARVLGIARDEHAALRRLIAEGLEADILVLSGGVSAGVLDLVPAVLAELGVEQVFHKVQLKPGKPLWFGTSTSTGTQKLVFGLPGNPVSSFVCFELFVRPAIAQLAGRKFNGHRKIKARLTAPHLQRGDRPSFHPAVWIESSTVSAGLPTVESLRWAGSGDLRGLAPANALAYFPPGDQQYQPDDVIEVLPI